MSLKKYTLYFISNVVIYVFDYSAQYSMHASIYGVGIRWFQSINPPKNLLDPTPYHQYENDRWCEKNSDFALTVCRMGNVQWLDDQQLKQKPACMINHQFFLAVRNSNWIRLCYLMATVTLIKGMGFYGVMCKWQLVAIHYYRTWFQILPANVFVATIRAENAWNSIILYRWVQCKKDIRVTPLLKHWSYIFLALTHRYVHRTVKSWIYFPSGLNEFRQMIHHPGE